MPARQSSPRIPLPRSWTSRVKSAILHAISLAQFAMVQARGWAADSANGRPHLKAENHGLRQELALVREEIRIKDSRMARIDPHRRPYYPPTERMAILELKAARGWSLEQTAKTFFVTATTVASWVNRVDEHGRDALVPVQAHPGQKRSRLRKSLNSGRGEPQIHHILCFPAGGAAS